MDAPISIIITFTDDSKMAAKIIHEEGSFSFSVLPNYPPIKHLTIHAPKSKAEFP